MWTRDPLEVTDPSADSWLGLEAAGEPNPPRPDLARGTGAAVTPDSALAAPTGLGMDVTAPSTWTRPYNPQPGMFTRLHRETSSR